MIRVGIGYDIHKVSKKRKLILGGVHIKETNFGLLGHSDADVLVHCICDAILGAVCLGDIGTYFPDTKKEFKNISSLILLEKTIEMINKKNWKLLSIDSIIITEKPKLAPYIYKMRESISKITKIPIDCIGIKAKTNEKIGEIGKGNAIAAFANVVMSNVEYCLNKNY